MEGEKPAFSVPSEKLKDGLDSLKKH